MLCRMDWWTFEGADASMPPPGLACVMQDLKLSSFNVQWFRDLGASFSSFGCFVFESWMLRFRVLGASFSDLGASCFGLHFRVLRFRNYPSRTAKMCSRKPQKIANQENKTPAKFSCYTVVLLMFIGCRF